MEESGSRARVAGVSEDPARMESWIRERLVKAARGLPGDDRSVADDGGRGAGLAGPGRVRRRNWLRAAADSAAGADNAVRPGRSHFDHHEGVLPCSTFQAASDRCRQLSDDASPCYCDWRTSA